MPKFDIEAGFISKLLEIKDTGIIKDARITPHFFTGDSKSAYKYIYDVVLDTGEVPTVRAFKRKFPHYDLETHTVEGERVVGTDENISYWCNELRNKKRHNTLSNAISKSAEYLQDFKAPEALTYMKQQIAFLESEIEESTDVDITKNTLDRKREYLKRKENQGMRGLPTGIPFLDYAIKGLEKETLITLIANTGVGKALTLSTPVLTDSGFIPMRDIKVGDKVCSKDGNFYNVSAVYPQGNKSVYRVKFEDGTYVDCCSEHLWVYKSVDDIVRKKDWRVDTLSNIMKNHPIRRGRNFNLCVPVCDKVKFKKKSLPLDPYVLGALLGDGGFTTDRISFSSIDRELVDKLNLRLRLTNFNGKFISTTDKNLQYTFKSNDIRENKLFRCIKSLGLQGTTSETKFIPDIYMYSSVEDRLELVRGLVDTDGTVNKKGFVIYHTGSKYLCNSFAQIIRSLGYRCRVRKYNRGIKNLPEYKVFVSAKTDELFSTTHRKDQFDSRIEVKRPNHYDILKIVSVEPMHYEEEMQCITVDSPDHTFICGDYIVTHNTWLEVYIGAYCMLQNCRVLHFITEMSESSMRDRYEAMLFSMCYGEMNYANFKSGKLPLKVEKQYFEFLENDLPSLEPLELITVTGVMSVSAGIEKYKPDLVLIDGAYLMEDDQGAESDWLRVAHITRDLKKLAKRAKVPIFINNQADKNTSKKTGPELGDISYTQAIGQDSDIVLALFRDQAMIADKEMMLKVLKSREGERGKCTLNWDFDTMNFSEIFSEGVTQVDDEENDGSDEAEGTLDIMT